MKNQIINLFVTPIEKFFKIEAASGIVLIFFAILAMMLANSRYADLYFEILNYKILFLSIGHWVNDALMAIFFFIVGLEIKKEIVAGELSSFRKSILPVGAAIGGMIVPASIYVYLNRDGGNMNAWAIPMATDIAFALGVLSLFGSRVPLNLKIFLLALAIVDDLGAVITIALFYTNDIKLLGLLIAAIGLALTVSFRRFRIGNYLVYIFTGLIVWIGFLYSGVHATIAGVLMGLMTPYTFYRKSTDGISVTYSPVNDWIHFLHPYVGFLIMPIFALANAGVSFNGVSYEVIQNSAISNGIIGGLILGKPIGILSISAMLIVFKIAELPKNVNWISYTSISLLAGIGFTMSIFISSLSLVGEELVQAKIGILLGSGLSALLGGFLFWVSSRKKNDSDMYIRPN